MVSGVIVDVVYGIAVARKDNSDGFVFVLSSQNTLPSRGTPTGWYLPELVHPYVALSPLFDIIVVSPKGREAPLDPYPIEATKADHECLRSLLGKASEFAGIFYVGGHSQMFDLASDETSHALGREFYESGKVVSAVCHGPAALANVKLSDGTYLVAGQEATGLSNAEEDIMDFTNDMPFLLETKLRENGGIYQKSDITGQNPSSAAMIGTSLINATGLYP
ncbi:hypothetical protein BDW75DRAFT_234885 [Aspergillus navahoensis]